VWFGLVGARPGYSESLQGSQADQSTASLNSTVQDSKSPKNEHFVAGELVFVHVTADSNSLLNGAFFIDKEGFVEIPILGKLYILNHTPESFARIISEKGAAYMKDTHVTTRPVIRMTYLGNWKKPGMYYTNPDIALWDALYRSQGPINEKNIKKMYVLRGNDRLTIDVLDAYSKGTSIVDAGMQSGDIIILPTPGQGFWYYFRDSFTLIATIATSIGTVVNTYLLIDRM